MCVKMRSGIQGSHIPEVVSYPATSNDFTYKTNVDDDLDDGHKIIYLSQDFILCQVEL